MKTLTTSRLKRILTSTFLFVLISLFTTSCYYHDDPYHQTYGYDGDAFLSLTWSNDRPDYLDAGTADIPAYFEWGRYYHVRSGFYTCYYEGYFWDYTHYATYAWEVDYEIWINYGVNSNHSHPAYNGADTYFELELNPYGPYVYHPYKSSEVEDVDFEVLEESADKIVILKKTEAFSMKITYKKREATHLDVSEMEK